LVFLGAFAGVDFSVGAAFLAGAFAGALAGAAFLTFLGALTVLEGLEGLEGLAGLAVSFAFWLFSNASSQILAVMSSATSGTIARIFEAVPPETGFSYPWARAI
jgi:hypothetical protein